MSWEYDSMILIIVLLFIIIRFCVKNEEEYAIEDIATCRKCLSFTQTLQ